jgi:NAD(P)-dependent dehydrogenase (short-subunit alcohol dehydrogenase family)
LKECGLNKTILITGTTSGVGAAIAYYYIEKGWNVIGFARGESIFQFENYKHFEVDITNTLLLSFVFEQIDNIDILINNAAIFKMKPFSQTSIDEIDDMIDINLKGAMYVTRFALQKMKKGSRIFFINSVAGLEELENQSAYCSSKHGLTGFAGVLGQELRPRGIKVTSIHPGGIDTPLWNRDIPYPCGDVSKAISPIELVKLIDFVYNSKFNIEYKTIKMFPDTEWHK